MGRVREWRRKGVEGRGSGGVEEKGSGGESEGRERKGVGRVRE